MPTYNCKHSGDQYSITKFNRHGEVESSYLCDHVSCQCPAGVRDTCRHRLMLPTFLEQGLVNTNLFLDWDNGKRIVDFNGLPATVQSHVDETPGDTTMTALCPPGCCSPFLAPQALTDTYAQDPAHSPAHDLFNLPQYHGVTIKEVDGLAAPAAGDTSGLRPYEDTIDRSLVEHKPEDSFREHLHKEGKVPRHLHPQEVHTDKNPWRRW